MSTLLDPRWHWMRSALSRLYAELDPEAQPGSLSLIVTCGNELLSYCVAVGAPEIQRLVVADVDGLCEAVEAATVDASPG